MEDLTQRFAYHRPRDQQVVDAHQRVRSACYRVAQTLVEVADDCRELSLAITKLEEAMMWANAAIARHQS